MKKLFRLKPAGSRALERRPIRRDHRRRHAGCGGGLVGARRRMGMGCRLLGLRGDVAQPLRKRAAAAAIDEGPYRPELVNSEIVGS